MKRTSLLKTMLLLCALIVGSSSAWAGTIDDVLNRTFTGVTGTSYTDFSGKTGSSGAVYAGNCAGGNESIQLRAKNSTSGVVTTTSGGKVKKIVVVWNSNTQSGRTVNVYGKNAAYSAATDLYDDSKQGTLLGTIVCGTSTELTVEDEYEFVGFRSAADAMYLTSVTITWESDVTPTVATPAISGEENFLKSTEVSITCDTEGAAIQYTTDAGKTWNDYSKPFTLTATTTVTAKATKSGMNNSEVATKTFTKIPVLTVVEALAAIDALEDNGTIENQYVEGIVSQVDSYNSSYKSITYWISKDGTTTTQLEVYSGKGLNGANFSAITDLAVGDEVVVKGTLKKYVSGSTTTPEFTANSQLVSLTHTAVPTITSTETSLTGFSYVYGSGPSAAQSFSVSGSALTADITVTPTANYEVSLAEASGYASSLTLTQTAGTVDNTKIYVRLKAGLAAGTQEGTVSMESTGATKVKVSLTGSVTGVVVATIPFTETFAGAAGTGGNDGEWSGSIASKDLTDACFDNTGWDCTKGNAASECIKLGASSAKGSATTPTLAFEAGKTYLLTFKAGAWDTSSEKTTIKLSTTCGGTLSTASISMTKAAFTTYQVAITGATGAGTITFEASVKNNNRFFLDDVQVQEAAATVTLTPAKQYTTLTSTFGLDFTGSDITAYIVKDKDASDKAITLTQVNKVPANTGLVLKAKNPTTAVEVPILTGEADDMTGNLMAGSASVPTAIAENAGYILSGGKFHPATEGTLPAGKAYLKLAVSSSASELKLEFEGETTKITTTNFTNDTNNNGVFYNLNGQRVTQPTKGLYIVNGKKYIVK